MISSIQYQLLKDIKNGKRIDDQKYFDEVLALRKKGYVTLIFGKGYVLQGDWLSAIEEYENAQKSEKRESETLSLAKEANSIAKESNDISREANKKSDKSNRIALGSLIAAIVSIVVAVVAIIVSVT